MYVVIFVRIVYLYSFHLSSQDVVLVAVPLKKERKKLLRCTISISRTNNSRNSLIKLEKSQFSISLPIVGNRRLDRNESSKKRRKEGRKEGRKEVHESENLRSCHCLFRWSNRYIFLALGTRYEQDTSPPRERPGLPVTFSYIYIYI